MINTWTRGWEFIMFVTITYYFIILNYFSWKVIFTFYKHSAYVTSPFWTFSFLEEQNQQHKTYLRRQSQTGIDCFIAQCTKFKVVVLYTILLSTWDICSSIWRQCDQTERTATTMVPARLSCVHQDDSFNPSPFHM